MIERGVRTPYVETLVAISKALGLTLSQLFLDLNGPRAKDGPTQDLPLLAYLGSLHLSSGDVAALIRAAKFMFDGRP